MEEEKTKLTKPLIYKINTMKNKDKTDLLGRVIAVVLYVQNGVFNQEKNW